MKTPLIQTAAVAYYEFRMQWRRRAMLVMILAMLVTTVIPVLVIGHEISNKENIDEKVKTVSTTGVIGITFIPIGALLAAVLPFVVVDVIPKDRQLGVSEVLDSTPLSPGAYLTGKLLGAWISIFVCVTSVVLVVGILWRLLIGPFNVGKCLEVWWFGLVSMIVINIGLSILLTAGQSDARRAVLVIILFFVLLPGVLGLNPSGNWRDLFNPLRPGLFYRYAVLDPTRLKYLSISVTIGSGLMQLVLLWVIMWAWMRWRGGRRGGIFVFRRS